MKEPDPTSLTEFQALIRESGVPCLADFFADWCPPCRAMNPHVEAIKEKMEEKLGILKVLKINVDMSPDIAAHFGVRSIPTFIMFVQGNEKWRHVGADAAGLTKKIEETLKELS